MGGIDKDRHRPWLGYALEEALRRSLFSAKDLVVYVNPDVLVAQLPHQVISELLSRALASGTFSATQIVETAPPALLAEYLDPELVWRCLKDVAERSGLSKKGGSRGAAARQWLAGVVQRALESELVSPTDMLRFVPPAEFVSDATRSVIADLIKSGLQRGTFDPALVLQHLTPTVMAENLESSLVWACIADAVSRSFEIAGVPAKADDGNSARVPLPRAPFKLADGLENEKTPPPNLERTLERPPLATTFAPAPAPAPAPAAKPKSTSATASGRIDNLPPPRPPVAPLSAAKPAANEWRPADDLDVLEEETIPPTRARS